VEVSRTTTLIDAIAGGIWSSSNAAVATISYEGIVSGLTTGSTTVSYTLTNLDGCSASSTVEVNVRDVNSGIHGTFELFPNPTNYQLTVAWSNQYAKYADIVITDMLGQFVYKGFLDMPTSKGQQVIPLEGIASGMYIVNIKYAGDFYDSKISIVK
jgi:hypothetical protein